MAQASTKKKTSEEAKRPQDIRPSEEARTSEGKSDFRIYLGPPVASPDVHLAPGTVFREKPKLPRELSFLSEWFFQVDKNLYRIRREIRTERSELNLKYREAMKKVGEYMRKKREV